MIAVIDLKLGNTNSLQKALKKIGQDSVATVDKQVISEAERLILPGVGSFKQGSANLKEFGLMDFLQDQVLNGGKPILGICLGMQLLAKKSFEHGENDGLGFIDADVVPLDHDGAKRKRQIHIGWNDVNFNATNPMFNEVDEGACFYFVHGYHMIAKEEPTELARVDYDGEIIAAFRKNNVWGTQFHPEKSQKSGLQVLRNYCNLC